MHCLSSLVGRVIGWARIRRPRLTRTPISKKTT